MLLMSLLYNRGCEWQAKWLNGTPITNKSWAGVWICIRTKHLIGLRLCQLLFPCPILNPGEEMWGNLVAPWRGWPVSMESELLPAAVQYSVTPRSSVLASRQQSGALCTQFATSHSWAVFFFIYGLWSLPAIFFPRSAFKYATFVFLYVDAGWTVMINQVLGALWGKRWWRNTFEENFSLSSSYLRKQAPFIFLGLMWDEYRPPRIMGLHIRGRKWGLSLALGFFKHLCCVIWAPLLPTLSLPPKLSTSLSKPDK